MSQVPIDLTASIPCSAVDALPPEGGMLLATLIFLPVILIYTAIVFTVLRGRVTAKGIEHNSSGFY